MNSKLLCAVVFVAPHTRARRASPDGRRARRRREIFSTRPSRRATGTRDRTRATRRGVRSVQRRVPSLNDQRPRVMSPVRRSRRVAASARTRTNGLGNNPLVDLTNRGGAAQSSGARGAVKAGKTRRAEVAGAASRGAPSRGVKRDAPSSGEATRKKTKKDDFSCEETMPETRGTRALETHFRPRDARVLSFEIF